MTFFCCETDNQKANSTSHTLLAACTYGLRLNLCLSLAGHQDKFHTPHH